MKSLWLLRTLALAGFLISAYLFVQKATGQIDSIVGCGAKSGCSNVLGSRWSQFFGIPVSGLSALMYLALGVATWKPSRSVNVALGICFTGAALWFVAILVIKLKAFCPWCTAMHVIGLSCAAILFLTLRKVDSAKLPVLKLAPAGAVLAVLALILGQLFGPAPQTHAEESGVTINDGDQPKPESGGSGNSGRGRLVSLPNSNKSFHTGFMPHLGPADAPHVIVKYFDYTCASCRDMHEDLHKVEEKFPGKICMIMLPVPLNRACNPHFPASQENHEHACELARLGLAAWRAKPEAFAEVHDQLFNRPVLPPEVAEIAVGQIVGEEALATALEDPWVEETLQADLRDFQQLIKQRLAMPKILIVEKGRLLHGLTRNADELIAVLAKDFGLKPE